MISVPYLLMIHDRCSVASSGRRVLYVRHFVTRLSRILRIDLACYGSLYTTLCVVLCRFYFGVLTFYFRILSFLFMCSVYDVVHFKRRNSRGRDQI